MMSNVLNTDGFYFCTDYDLTHTLQRLGNTSPDFQDSSLLERVRGTSLTSTTTTCMHITERRRGAFQLDSVYCRET